MTYTSHNNHLFQGILCVLFLLLTVHPASAQITIGGNVYGGGNAGDVGGNTTVTVRNGDIHAVFGGARMANVEGRSFVNIDGEHASDYIVIDYVYGGNDISGTIGTSTELPQDENDNPILTKTTENGIDNTWNAFVRISRSTKVENGETVDNHKMYIGQLFAGGNGDYDYEDDGTNHIIKKKGTDEVVATIAKSSGDDFSIPNLAKTYLELLSGSIVYAYGGGNNATVTERTVIHYENPSAVVNSIIDADNPNADSSGEVLNDARFKDKMGINTGFSYPSSDAFQVGRFFGGNNRAEMTIRPTWNLLSGKIRSLYSGGNQGDMTSPDGLLLEIPETSTLMVDNLYGGCRMAQVRPKENGVELPQVRSINFEGGVRKYYFPEGLSARVLVRGGDVNNVYGGNDVTGDVYGGNAVGVYASIRGNLYGGGNGAYPYTDNDALKDDQIYGDFYYTVPSGNSAEALNAFRPNAEGVSIRVWGPDADHRTVIGGAIYLGGNCATIETETNSTSGGQKLAELKIGSNVLADKVFLGNNGEGMITTQGGEGSAGGVLYTYQRTDLSGDNSKFNSMDLKDAATFAKYMEGCAIKLHPTIVFDDTEKGDPYTYVDYSTAFGSFFCGGNVGSVIIEGTEKIDFSHPIIVFNKVVGGSNDANVTETTYNAAYKGGLMNTSAWDDTQATIPDKLILNFYDGLEIQPLRWKMEKTELTDLTGLTVGQDYVTEGSKNYKIGADGNYEYSSYVPDANGNRQLEWNTFDIRTGLDVTSPTTTGTTDDDDMNRRLRGGNIFGGCYNSGHVEGNVVININGTTLDHEKIFDVATPNDGSDPNVLYGHSSYTITERHSGVILDEQGMDALGDALNVFGGGKGADTEIWGSTTINVNKGYTFQAFGGSYEGLIGKRPDDGILKYDKRYSTTINLQGTEAGKPKTETSSDNMPEMVFIYGGGFEGPVMGNTRINLDNGRIFNTFAGACNADIYGHTETYVGVNGFPYVIDHIYGGNDLGGKILGETTQGANGADCDFTSRIRTDIQSSIYNPSVNPVASAYIEYQKGHIVNIYGGCYGVYDYEGEYSPYKDNTPRLGNAFVNFIPVTTNNANNGVTAVFGAGEGQSQVVDRDVMQRRSYILVDIPQNITTFQSMQVFGSGAYSGLGMEQSFDDTKATASDPTRPDLNSAVIDLFRGQIRAVYGASYNEGITRRTVVNVPEISTIKLDTIFGGGFGINNQYPCDAFEAIVNYRSSNAIVSQGLFGGNNNARRTLYGQVNVFSPVYSNDTKTMLATVYGAGKGTNTWSQYTEVNLENGAEVYRAYGGGQAGKVLNKESVDAWKATDATLWTELGTGYTDTGLTCELARETELGPKYNANVHIKEGATVHDYCYGAGLGVDAVVSGTSYADLLGGTVVKDLYAAGTSGAVEDLYAAKNFIASANAYIRGGKVRNVYGGGWEGAVGHKGATLADDILGETHVVIGDLNGTDFVNGIPAIARNAFGGGEGGPTYGTSNITINNGYVGYVYNDSGTDNTATAIDERYEEKLDDETAENGGVGNLIESGNLYGAGYVDYSNVDSTNVEMYGGYVRNSIYGGGEIGSVGRATMSGDTPTIEKGGSTTVTIYKGNVLRDVFGGGKGHDALGRVGTLHTDGYVFGSTDVHIHGGEIGTSETLKLGYGNVFGGGNVGYVYSATGQKVGTRQTDEQLVNGVPTNGGGYYYVDGDKTKNMTVDCNVDVSPYCQVTAAGGVTIDGTTYAQGDWVPVEALNKLRNKTADATSWNALDVSGIIIHNAVFAGGNTSAGSDVVFANATTVYGNAVAALRDVYHRDFITLGTEHTGGLYGDGNLTFVDGYRELHISNYGTDYYGMSDVISIEDYRNMSDRERAYFQLEYECKQACEDKNGTHYDVGAKLTSEEFAELFDGTNGTDAYTNETYWTEYGTCSIYAGRLLNTIQRADMVGVFGSRMVLQGALDRVPEKADYTNYTINRVGEVSLNVAHTQAAGDTAEEDLIHGNYFGIYSVVNYLGNLTSDVFMSDVRTTDTTNPNNAADGTTTYHGWKSSHATQANRNNATSHNKVALASGVYLEIQREESEKAGKTIWGYVTGVIELDLINVLTGQGGGYVYAKNAHQGYTHHDDWNKVILSPYNSEAKTYKKFEFTGAIESIETSGNFVHNAEQIVDDCFPIANKYEGSDASPAHYWYIKGTVYVYDQYISAYTGSANAYSESVTLPLTITAASHGKMTLRDIQPNYYAYYDQNGQKLGVGEETLVANNITYSLNDPITWWEYNQLDEISKSRFVAETYTVVEKCRIDGVEYAKGATMLPSEAAALWTKTAEVYDEDESEYYVDNDKPATFLVRPSNNVSHGTGYVLTFDINNPMVWNDWYTSTTGGLNNRKNTDEYAALSVGDQGAYTVAPTYYLNTGTDAVYGQKDYVKGDIITNRIFDTYNAIPAANRNSLTNQATFEEAWMVTAEIETLNKDNVEQHLYPGVAINKSDYTDAQWSAISSKVALANIVTSTLQLDESNYLFAGDLITDAEKTALLSQYTDLTETKLNEYVAKAYYCTEAGKYGGDLYKTGTAYQAIDAWCSMSEEDRANFTFNYDALDVLIDPTYSGTAGLKYQYDSSAATLAGAVANPPSYSLTRHIDYQATYDGTSNLTFQDASGTSVTYAPSTVLSREQYEAVPNERYHYTAIEVSAAGDYYVVNTTFVRGDEPYAPGQVITQQVYDALNSQQKDCIDIITFDDTLAGDAITTKTYFYCREAYIAGANGSERGNPDEINVTDIWDSSKSYTKGQNVPQGIVISEENYMKLVNLQHDFTITGNAPIETSTFYVSRESDIYDLSKEKIITLVYLYEYQESDEAGIHITPLSERHIVNIHLQFKSGVPEIGQLLKPATVLPGSTVGLKVPNVEPGAYEILSSGWELFTNQQDAISHKNGQAYLNNSTPMYWYQDGYYVAYYAKTYLGKTYSNAVPFSVANYHDLGEVMNDKAHHMYVDHEDVHRDPKIYLDSRDPADPSKSKLDLLKDFFDLTLHTAQYDMDGNPIAISDGSALDGHNGVNTTQIGASKNLEFILKSDVSPKAYTTWDPIGTATQCFEGVLHGDGYTVSGLSNSLFKNLCGEVYNLGVTGTFTSAGVVDTGTGYVENCWVMSDAATVDNSVKAVFGNPSDSKGTQVVNCYYPATNAYSETDNARGNARKMPEQSFYNGEVAYDLNGFYLQKRYFDGKPLTEGTAYSYYIANADGTLPTDPVTGKATPSTAYYTSDYAIYPLDSERNGGKSFGYVENRYADGDFIYAGGYVPENDNERLYEHPSLGNHYYPIWPDDYLFFGQMLTYGYVSTRPHQDQPSHVNKTSGRLSTVAFENNRVFRAPAYFQSKEMSMAHYNPYAVFAAKSADDAHTVYPNMTAIDFTGGNGDVAGGYKQGLQSGGLFFPPMLDCDGLTFFRNAGLTKNLLAYTPNTTGTATDAVSKTYEAVTSALQESDYAETDANYRTVAKKDVSDIYGHAVVKSGTDPTTDADYIAPFDQFLVDKQDFNAPIAYTFEANKRMWYQRTPERFVDLTKGWEAVSLPFSAELVTTQTKGELTHFYENNITGHEYWLRRLKENSTLTQKQDDNGNDVTGVYTADFSPLAAGANEKEYTNTFLWDYYYSQNSQQDKNADTYQTYYSATHRFTGYPYSDAGSPYLIGFPGSTYYEFDLSGTWQPINTFGYPSTQIDRLEKQTVTFVSPTEITIQVSDDELEAGKVDATYNGSSYTFTPNYLGKSIPASTTFVLNDDGSSFEVLSTESTSVPFRPYFTMSGSQPVKGTRSIVFGYPNTEFGSDEEPDQGNAAGEGLIVSAKHKHIYVTSAYNNEVEVVIVNTAGAVVNSFSLQPGETMETTVASGIYMVNKIKIAVK